MRVGGGLTAAPGLAMELRSHRSDGQGGERWLKHPSPCAETPVALLSLSSGSVWEQPGEKGLPRGTLESPQIPSQAPGSPHFDLRGSKYQELHWHVSDAQGCFGHPTAVHCNAQ